MKTLTAVDLADAHRFFAADSFNRAREIMKQLRRSPRDEELLIMLCHASLWHWLECDDCSDEHLSAAYWQTSHAYSLLDRSRDAMHYGELCLHHSHGLAPVYLACAHEALARAAMVSGDAEAEVRHLDAAGRFVAQIGDVEERARVNADLATIC